MKTNLCYDVLSGKKAKGIAELMDLDALYNHEVSYFAFSSACEDGPCARFLDCADLPDSRDVNRALRLRDDGRGPDAVVRSVVSHFRAHGTRVTAEVDAVSEAQGIGFALRKLGITPVLHSRALMRYSGGSRTTPPSDSPDSIDVIEVKGTNKGSLVRAWLRTNLHDIDGFENASTWRVLAEREASSPHVRLFLGLWQGHPTTTCSLFEENGLARIEMVETLPEYRKRGIASAVISRTIAELTASEGVETYLYTGYGSDAERLYSHLGFVTDTIDIMRRHIEG